MIQKKEPQIDLLPAISVQNKSKFEVYGEEMIEKKMEKGIKIRKIRIEDVSEIVSIQESILQKRVSKK